MQPRTPAASSVGLTLLARHDLGGYGDGMQVVRSGDALYVGHTGTTGMGTSVLDVSDPAHPVLVSHGLRLLARTPTRSRSRTACCLSTTRSSRTGR